MEIVNIIKNLNKGNKEFLDTSLQFIQYELKTYFAYIAKIHLVSAGQALMAATTSNNPEMEIRVGIGHLRDVFNTYQLQIEKRIERGIVWFGLFREDIKAEEVTDHQLKLSIVAFVISLMYKKVGDESNYIAWKNIGLGYSTPYVNNRKSAINDWKNATRPVSSSPYRTDSTEDWEKRKKYEQELMFVDAFSELVNDI